MVGRCRISALWLVVCGLTVAAANAGEPTAASPEATAGGTGDTKRVLLLGQSPDGHPWSTHEYMAGLRILRQCLEPVDSLETVLIKADDPWPEGPQLIDRADGVVLFLSEGAKWVHQDPDRLAAFRRLAGRGGGLIGWHWGIGCRQAEPVDAFLELFGGCHGGPDRKYKIVRVKTEIARPSHPVMRGIEPIDVRDEFYYRLKFVQPAGQITPLLKVPIEGESHTVAWAWERPDGGRSFGFSGGHFHRHWKHEAYRRMAVQAVLWTMKRDAPESLPLEFSEKDLRLPRPKPE